jgi:hypothetical protein
MPLPGESGRDVLIPGVETSGSITPLLRSEELSLMRMGHWVTVYKTGDDHRDFNWYEDF